jgi:geranylgeranyl diphosphate synthase type II
MLTLADRFSAEIHEINEFINTCISEKSKVPELSYFHEACRYSLVNPGKRFRALLAVLTARALLKNKPKDSPSNNDEKYIYPFGTAVELIHTYSLIHDDLPSMDNDDFRRGKPSHHKVYGEAMAIISGDALQALAFEMIANNYKDIPSQALKAVGELANASGYKGMVGGQALDILIGKGLKATPTNLEVLHHLKTGRLIEASILGSAILCGASSQQEKHFSTFGRCLGLGFQIADDILDYDPQNPEPMGYPTHFGLEKTVKMLSDITNEGLLALDNLNLDTKDLKSIAQFNLERVN